MRWLFGGISAGCGDRVGVRRKGLVRDAVALRRHQRWLRGPGGSASQGVWCVMRWLCGGGPQVAEAATVDTEAVLGSAQGRLRNGDTDGAMQYASGLGEVLNDAYDASVAANSSSALARRRRRRLSGIARQGPVLRQLMQTEAGAAAGQREELLDLVGTVHGMLFATSASTASLAETVDEVARAPCDLTAGAQGKALDLVDGLVAGAQDLFTDTRLTIEAAGRLAGTLNSVNVAGQPRACNASGAALPEALPEARASGANRTAECVTRLGQLGGALLIGSVPGEDPKEVTSPTLALSTQRCRADLPDSCLYTKPLAAPPGWGASASFPSSLGTALADQEGTVAAPPTASSNCTAEGGGGNCTEQAAAPLLPRRPVDARIMAATSELHAPSEKNGSLALAEEELDVEENVEERVMVEGGTFADVEGGSTRVVVMDTNGTELRVEGLTEPVEVRLPLGAEYRGTVADVEARIGRPWVGFMECRFWNEANASYSTAGCQPLPNPAPAGADLYWRDWPSGDEVPRSLAALWGVGNRALTDGCEEVWGAAVEEYNGTDAGVRKYGNLSWGVGGLQWRAAGCPLVDGEVNATLKCRWEWRRQVFEGPGCVVAAEQSCLCTHLTDFKAVLQLDVQNSEPPRLNVLTLSDMTSLTLQDVLRSAVLLAVVCGIIATTVGLGVTCNWQDTAYRQKILESLVKHHGTGVHGFRAAVGGVWTWGIFEEDQLTGVERKSHHQFLAERAKQKASMGSVHGQVVALYGERALETQPRMVERLLGGQGRLHHARATPDPLGFRNRSFQKLTGALHAELDALKGAGQVVVGGTQEQGAPGIDAWETLCEAGKWELQATGAHVLRAGALTAAHAEHGTHSVTMPVRPVRDEEALVNSKFAEPKSFAELMPADWRPRAEARTMMFTSDSPGPLDPLLAASEVCTGGGTGGSAGKADAREAERIHQEPLEAGEGHGRGPLRRGSRELEGHSRKKRSRAELGRSDLAEARSRPRGQAGGHLGASPDAANTPLLDKHIQKHLQLDLKTGGIGHWRTPALQKSLAGIEREASEDFLVAEERPAWWKRWLPGGGWGTGKPRGGAQLPLMGRAGPQPVAEARERGGLGRAGAQRSLRERHAMQAAGDPGETGRGQAHRNLAQRFGHRGGGEGATSIAPAPRKSPQLGTEPPKAIARTLQRERAMPMSMMLAPGSTAKEWSEEGVRAGQRTSRQAAAGPGVMVRFSQKAPSRAATPSQRPSSSRAAHPQTVGALGPSIPPAAGQLGPVIPPPAGQQRTETIDDMDDLTDLMMLENAIEEYVNATAPTGRRAPQVDRGDFSWSSSGSEGEAEDDLTDRRRSPWEAGLPRVMPRPGPGRGGRGEACREGGTGHGGRAVPGVVLGEQAVHKAACKAVSPDITAGRSPAAQVSPDIDVAAGRSPAAQVSPDIDVAAGRSPAAQVSRPEAAAESGSAGCKPVGLPMVAAREVPAVAPLSLEEEAERAVCVVRSPSLALLDGAAAEPVKLAPSELPPQGVAPGADPNEAVDVARPDPAGVMARAEQSPDPTEEVVLAGKIPTQAKVTTEMVPTQATVTTEMVPAETAVMAGVDLKGATGMVGVDPRVMAVMAGAGPTEAMAIGSDKRVKAVIWAPDSTRIGRQTSSEQGLTLGADEVPGEGPPASSAAQETARRRVDTAETQCIQKTDPGSSSSGGDFSPMAISMQVPTEAALEMEERAHTPERPRAPRKMLRQETAKSRAEMMAMLRRREISRKQRQIERAAAVGARLDPLGQYVVRRYMRDFAAQLRSLRGPDPRLWRAAARYNRTWLRDPVVRRRLLLKFKCCAIFLRQLAMRQDLRATDALCSIMGFTSTALGLCLPMPELRQMVDAARTEMEGPEAAAGRKEGEGGERAARPTPSEASGPQRLPMERLLGTALVLAYMHMRRIVREEQVEAQLKAAGRLRWGAHLISFEECVVRFKVMLMVNRESQGWHHRSLLWNLLFLQHPAGCYDLSPGLATVLHAGDTAATLQVDATAQVPTTELLASLPEALHSCGLDAACEEQAWGTLLAAAKLAQLPFAWVLNPQDKPSEQRTLLSTANDYLGDLAAEHPKLNAELPNLRCQAEGLVTFWRDSRLEAMMEMRERVLADQSVLDSQLSPEERRAAFWQRWRGRFEWAMMRHPWISIVYTLPSDSYSRAQRMLVQCTSMITMLLITLWLFYSKGVECCTAFKEHLGCEDTSVEGECLGLTSCEDLYRARDDGRMPGHLQAEDFSCSAFPQPTLMDKLWLSTIVLGTMLPLNLTLQALFRTGGTPSVPSHWVPVNLQHFNDQRSSATLLDNALFLATALLLDSNRLARALARYFVPVAAFLDALFRGILRIWRLGTDSLPWFGDSFWLLWKVHVRRCDVHLVLQELEIVAQQRELHRQARQLALATFLQARHEMQGFSTQLGYVTLLLLWMLLLWFQLVYAVLIRSMLGEAAELEVIRSWAITIVVDTLGVNVVYMICCRSLVVWILHKRLQYSKVGCCPAGPRPTESARPASVWKGGVAEDVPGFRSAP
ncbi:hypothetical protein CYMTET_31041 [Cymbomonas tetramitiformis]|uniref:Uncharacterized protein n=1 Tax=Cymbomonas tetramitiformis TaxID=36881 RepID=A0AAE0KTJ3_9CHLO|nr:hypothetical protein CYMTET_31041 [Cymbomonas tetramitiformis]